MSALLLVALGGFLGSVSRLAISIQLNKHIISTFVANLTGSIIMVITFHLYMTTTLSEELWLFLGVGFCGAYTTFSTFSYESLILMINKQYGTALMYIIGSFISVFCFIALILYLFK